MDGRVGKEKARNGVGEDRQVFPFYPLSMIFPILASFFQVDDVPIFLALVAMEEGVIICGLFTETAVMFYYS